MKNRKVSVIRKKCFFWCLLSLVLATAPVLADGLGAAHAPLAPAFTLKNLQGDRVKLSDYRGKLVLLNFWATWCMPCRQEMPSMEQLRQIYGERGLVILAVSTDEGGESRIRNFARRLKLTFPILLDPDSTASDKYEVSGVPVSFLIDHQGRIVARMTGSKDWVSDAALEQIEALL